MFSYFSAIVSGINEFCLHGLYVAIWRSTSLKRFNQIYNSIKLLDSAQPERFGYCLGTVLQSRVATCVYQHRFGVLRLIAAARLRGRLQSLLNKKTHLLADSASPILVPLRRRLLLCQGPCCPVTCLLSSSAAGHCAFSTSPSSSSPRSCPRLGWSAATAASPPPPPGSGHEHWPVVDIGKARRNTGPVRPAMDGRASGARVRCAPPLACDGSGDDLGLCGVLLSRSMLYLSVSRPLNWFGS